MPWQGEQLELTCTTNATYLFEMDVIATGWTRNSALCKVYFLYRCNSTSILHQNKLHFLTPQEFLFSQGRMPLVSRLLINPVNVTLNGTKLNCTVQRQMVADNISMASTTILIIGESCEHKYQLFYSDCIHTAAYFSNPEVITSVNYWTDNVTAFLQWTPESHTSYSVSAEIELQAIVTHSMPKSQYPIILITM